VVAHLGSASGGYASQAVVAASALHGLDGSLDAATAVALIGTGRTALVVLDAAALTAADVVVVTAAAGGLGCLLVQAGRRAGATVVGLAGGPTKVEQVAALGADVAVDYSLDGWADRVRGQLAERRATVVLDGVGGSLGRGAVDLLGPGGRIVLFGFASGEVTPITSSDLVARELSASWAIGPAAIERAGGIAVLEARAMAAAADGSLVPVVGRRFPLAEAAAAHVAVEARDTVGKTVLVP
jgi:NADPH2:quinone reductase